jgi:hypothetical protein
MAVTVYGRELFTSWQTESRKRGGDTRRGQSKVTVHGPLPPIDPTSYFYHLPITSSHYESIKEFSHSLGQRLQVPITSQKPIGWQRSHEPVGDISYSNQQL